MKSIYLVLILTFSLYSIKSQGQSIGDTIVVPVLDYSNASRNVVANFPTNPALSFEKVIMRYAMRCKNALVSTTGQRNLGCGEWDYSCNTYVTDSTKADSSSSSIARYSIFPDTNSSGIYSTLPTWNGIPTVQSNVTLQSILNEDTAAIGTGNVIDSLLFNPIGNGGKTYVLLTSAELLSGGLIAGDIDGFSFNNLASNSNLSQFRVKLKHTGLSDLANPDSVDFRNLQEVYFHNYAVSNGDNRVQFHSPFNWNGTSNLLIELSYKPGFGASTVQLQSDTTSQTKQISVSNDYALDLAPNNYIEANSYLGIAGSNSRTIEAWIKTSVAGNDIVSWGRNSSGEKFIFKLDGAGKLRVEVNGGSIIGTAILNDGKWHHVAVTFNGATMYNFKFYVDGVRDNPSGISNILVNTGQSLPVQISKGFHNRYWNGQVDNVRIWSTELTVSTIDQWRYKNISTGHPNYSALELEYNIDSRSSTVRDNSPNNRDATYFSQNTFLAFKGESHFKEFFPSSTKPNIDLYQGNYNLSINNDTLVDTTFYNPFIVNERTIYSNPGTVFSDSIGVVTTNYWPENNVLFDLNGGVLSTSPSLNTVQIIPSTLSYFRRSAAKVEIMSFVTPYGINLNLGIDGKAWYFDVSDFLPLLKGPHRITLERGGQNQEEMDIQFFFIVGTPPRDVKQLEQIWPVSSTAYASILNNSFFAPITINLDTSARQFKIRSVITGHGQQGEFIPRNHFININGGPVEFNRNVWSECAENPVFPQGGTWIYDRAGWCPGAPSDLTEYDITNLVGNADTVQVDYGVTTASGDSRYIVNNQLVSYGAPNFNLDARITEVISPTNDIQFGKGNPVCNGSEIEIQNSGATAITAMQIEYSINNGIKGTYNWTGNLNFMEKEIVVLPTIANYWNSLTNGTNTFVARIISTNGQSDQYIHNNDITRGFSASEVLSSNFVLEFTTNAAGFQSSYNVRDENGSVLVQRSSLASNSTYRDTFNLTAGCYSINVFDSNDDGLSFFGNSNGNGSVRIKNLTGSTLKIFEPNFGDGFKYSFTIPTTVSIDEVELSQSISIYPNPASNLLTLETTGLNNSIWSIFDGMGRRVASGLTLGEHHTKTKINVDNYAAGIYYMHLSNGGSTTVKKFVVSQ
ncbi:MAG: hypothetical protein ACJASF_000064 [Vicingaceae bacterium]|jgi:hypothetical protein